jgi:hypothetical protein
MKNIYADKFMLCMMTLAMIGLIVVLVMTFLGKFK